MTPEARGRIAFAALFASLCLIAADRTVTTGEPSPLFLLAPVITVIATGHVSAHEAFLRAGIAVALTAMAGLLVNLVHGRGVPDYQSFNALISALSGLLALNLMIIVATSFAVRRLWATSDHWTH